MSALLGEFEWKFPIFCFREAQSLAWPLFFLCVTSFNNRSAIVRANARPTRGLSAEYRVGDLIQTRSRCKTAKLSKNRGGTGLHSCWDKRSSSSLVWYSLSETCHSQLVPHSYMVLPDSGRYVFGALYTTRSTA
jgi:hypothetical protein